MAIVFAYYVVSQDKYTIVKLKRNSDYKLYSKFSFDNIIFVSRDNIIYSINNSHIQQRTGEGGGALKVTNFRGHMRSKSFLSLIHI